MYVSPVSMEEFDGDGSNTSAEVKNLWLWTLGLVALRAQGYRIK